MYYNFQNIKKSDYFQCNFKISFNLFSLDHDGVTVPVALAFTVYLPCLKMVWPTIRWYRLPHYPILPLLDNAGTQDYAASHTALLVIC